MIRKFVPALAVLLTITTALSANAAKKAAASKDAQKIEQLGKADAPTTGTFYFNLEVEPATLNPLLIADLYGQQVTTWTNDSLLSRNADTYAWEPGVAQSWDQSADGKTVSFKIRPNLKFSDGTPMTAEDVKFSYDVIMSGEYNTATLKPYYETIEKAEIVNGDTVKFTTKSKYFYNFSTLASLVILPKHIYGDAKAGNKLNKSVIGSGPYKIEKYELGQRITLVKNPNWFGYALPEMKGRYNFERIVLRFVKEENIAIEMVKKGDLDFIGWIGLQAENFTLKMVGPEWGKTVEKVKAENKQPKDYSFIGWNLTNDLFKERDVRVALAMLMNRPLMNQKFKFNMSQLAAGPWYPQSDYADPSVKPLPFDPKKAVAMLAKAGWTDSNKDGVIDKMVNGKLVSFEFTLLYANKDVEKYYTLYQEDLKKVGIKMNLKLIEWNAFSKALEEMKFDAVTMSWGGGDVELDPKQIWHSESAVKGGSNFISYKNPAVDKLIDEGRAELDRAKRVKDFRKIYKMIADDAPYLFMFAPKYALYAVDKKVVRTKDTFKYEIGSEFWYAAPVK